MHWYGGSDEATSTCGGASLVRIKNAECTRTVPNTHMLVFSNAARETLTVRLTASSASVALHVPGRCRIGGAGRFGGLVVGTQLHHVVGVAIVASPSLVLV